MWDSCYALRAEGERVSVRDCAGIQNKTPHCQVMAKVAIGVEHGIALSQDCQEDHQKEDIAQGWKEKKNEFIFHKVAMLQNYELNKIKPIIIVTSFCPDSIHGTKPNSFLELRTQQAKIIRETNEHKTKVELD
jgi:hypothetical protein